MQDDYDGWEIVKELASGGQGRVYVALSPDHVETRRKSTRQILDAVRAYSCRKQSHGDVGSAAWAFIGRSQRIGS